MSESCSASAETEVVQGWPKLWANFIALIGIFSQSVGPSLAVWANPVHFSFFCAVVCWSHHAGMLHSIISENGARQNVSAVLVQTSTSPPDGWFESEGVPIKAVRSVNISIHFTRVSLRIYR